MSIATELTALSTNLAAAKDAVTAKGGTVGDTGLAGLAAEIATIPAGGTETPSEAKLTAYDSTTGVITGENLGTTGTLYMLDRNTHTYIAQPTSSWSATSITLSTPIDLSTLEGTTSIVAADSDGKFSTKLLIKGEVAVTGKAKLYVQNPDTRAVRTIAITSNTNFEKLYNSTYNGYAKQITIDGDTFYFDEIVGIQFGSDFAGASIASYFLQYATNLNQPLDIPSSVTSIDLYFLQNCYSFNQPLNLSSVTSINNYFLSVCTSFNQPLDISSVTSIGSNFLYLCTSFNQPLTIPSSIASISSNFLDSCYSFNQPLDLSSVTSIGGNFLYNCYSFNQPLGISSATSIGYSFLRDCRSFNQTLNLSSVTSIGDYFLSACYSFNQPLDLSSVTSVGGNFLSDCRSFNQFLDISSITSISYSNFLSSCRSFNQPLDISSVTSISSNFLSGCTSFNQPLTIPSSVTSIGTNFLYNCCSFTNLTTETTTSPTDNNSLSTQYNTAKMYVKGVTVSGAGASTWITNLPDRTSSPYRKLIDGTA